MSRSWAEDHRRVRLDQRSERAADPQGQARQADRVGCVAQICEVTENDRKGARGLILTAGHAPGNPGENRLLPQTARELKHAGIRPRDRLRWPWTGFYRRWCRCPVGQRLPPLRQGSSSQRRRQWSGRVFRMRAGAKVLSLVPQSVCSLDETRPSLVRLLTALTEACSIWRCSPQHHGVSRL